MRSRVAVLSLVVMSIAWFVVAAKAQERNREGMRTRLAERIQDLDLTDQQETQLAEIRKEFRPKVDEQAKQFSSVVREEVEKARAVLTEEQIDELAEMREVRREHRAETLAERVAHLEELGLTGAEMQKITQIRETSRPAIEQALQELKGLLTDEQQKAREEALKAGKSRREMRAALPLTNEQKEKVAAVGKKLRAVVRADIEKIRDVLSPEQKEQLGEMREERTEHARDRVAAAIANAPDLHLTDEQKSKLGELRKEYRPKVQAAGDKLRAVVREELTAIAGVIKE